MKLKDLSFYFLNSIPITCLETKIVFWQNINYLETVYFCVSYVRFPSQHINFQRFDAQTGADREVQRILLELLNQMDGFDQTTNVKVLDEVAKS